MVAVADAAGILSAHQAGNGAEMEAPLVTAESKAAVAEVPRVAKEVALEGATAAQMVGTVGMASATRAEVAKVAATEATRGGRQRRQWRWRRRRE